ncbi:DUF3168 domain-containing protein [Sphingomonas sp.]|uniref:DUF3168 domain-containing protein n=1 Tax=Sphingomonas sp. TaxID=28214 RepID=UPI003B0064FE
MNAADAGQRALVAALRGAGIAVYDGPPLGAAYPYAAISEGSATDWSTKDARGRELRLSFAIWDDGGSAARLHALAAAAEDAVEAMPRDLPGYRVASLVLLRSRIVRDPDGPWAARLDYRVRMLATSHS